MMISIRHIVRCVLEEVRLIEYERRRRASADLWADFVAAQNSLPVTREVIRQILFEEAGHYLTDIEWRYRQARELVSEVGGGTALAVRGRQLTAEDLNTQNHVLTGYTLTNNSPTGGSIAWAALHVVYAGVDYLAVDGNTANKYVWFVKPGSGTSVTLTTGNTKPALTKDDVLLFINNAGIATVAAGTTHGSLPTALADNAVDFGALVDSAVSGTKIAAAGVGSGKLATGAVSASTMFGANVVDATAIGTNAVTNVKINALAVDSAKLAAAAVTAGKIATGGVSASTEFAAGVVNTAAIAALAVDSAKLAAAAVTAGKIATGGVSTAAQFAAGVVDTAAIGAAAVSPGKLNVLSHELY